MDLKPIDEFETEERPEEDAYDDFAGTLPDVSIETGTGLDDLSTISYEIEREKTKAKVKECYESFPEYEVDIAIKTRNVVKFSLEHKKID